MTDDSTALTLRRDYLDLHRRMLLGRAVAGTLAGIVPVPLLDTWLQKTILGGAYRRLAVAHNVDLDDDAVTNLVFGKTPPPGWLETTASTVAFRVAGQAWKRVLVVLTALRRVQSASRTFAALTLFDHYVQRRHTGMGLDAARALELRDTIGQVIMETPGGLSFEPFRRGLLGAARATARAPLELIDIASGGALRRRLDKGREEVAEAEVVDEVEAALERQLSDKEGFLGRAVASIEQQLSGDVNPYVDALIERFDQKWRG
jgi:hypothetical protein